MKQEKNLEQEENLDQEEKTINSKEVYTGRIIKVREDQVLLSNGNQAEREIVMHPGGVTVIAIADDDSILLVQQYRKPAEESLFELPAGKLEIGEDPLESAKRELIEETGYQAGKIDHLFTFYTSPGFCDEVIHLYIARNLKDVGVNPDQDEILENHSIKKEDIIEMIKTGKIKDSKTIIGLLYFLQGGIDV